MEKDQLLASIKSLSSKGILTKEEVLGAFENEKDHKKSVLTRKLGVSEVLYMTGGFIVVLGIAILVFQNWSELSLISKILATLGVGMTTYFTGVLLNKEDKYGAVGYAFHLIAALVIPIGLGVVFNEAGYDTGSAAIQSVITGILFVMYLASFLLFKKPIFTFFTIVYATWFFFSFTNFLIGPNPYFDQIKFYEYRFLLVGLSYLFLGFYMSHTDQRELTEPMYGIGSLLFLGAALILGGWKPEQNVFWELIFPGLVFGALFLSVYLKSRSFLSVGTIFLMVYILKITGEYFSGALGWPLSLVICGTSLIGVGYYAFTINRKYIRNSSLSQ